jgi:hypothetical protein
MKSRFWTGSPTVRNGFFPSRFMQSLHIDVSHFRFTSPFHLFVSNLGFTSSFHIFALHLLFTSSKQRLAAGFCRRRAIWLLAPHVFSQVVVKWYFFNVQDRDPDAPAKITDQTCRTAVPA